MGTVYGYVDDALHFFICTGCLLLLMDFKYVSCTAYLQNEK